MDVPGFLEARDPETGELQWRWNTKPRKGEPGAETWPNPQGHGARRRHDLDARHLRSRAEPDLLGHRQSQSRLRRTGPQGRQSLDRFDRRAQCRYRQTRLVLPAVAARHPRLGQRGNAGPLRRHFNGTAAQDAGAGRAQRHLLRARPHQRREPGDQGLRRRQLDEGRRRQGPADSRSRQGTESGWLADQYSRRRRHQLACRRASIRRPASSTSTPSRDTASPISPTPIPSLRATAEAEAAESPSRFSRPSITRPATSPGSTSIPSGGFGNAFPAS